MCLTSVYAAMHMQSQKAVTAHVKSKHLLHFFLYGIGLLIKFAEYLLAYIGLLTKEKKTK